MRSDNKVREVCNILSASKPIPNDEIEIKFYISSLGRDNAETIISYRKAMFDEDANGKATAILNGNSPLFLSELAINGRDLNNLGVKGKDIGEALDILLASVLKGEVENEKNALLEFFKSKRFELR